MYSVNENSKTVTIVLKRTEGTEGEIDVVLKTVEYTAKDHKHYNGINQKVHFKDKQVDELSQKIINYDSFSNTIILNKIFLMFL